MKKFVLLFTLIIIANTCYSAELGMAKTRTRNYVITSIHTRYDDLVTMGCYHHDVDYFITLPLSSLETEKNGRLKGFGYVSEKGFPYRNKEEIYVDGSVAKLLREIKIK